MKNKMPMDLVDMRFDFLTVISQRKINKKIKYTCQCECGKQIEINRETLLKRTNQSCGCKKNKSRPNRVKDLTGQVFGELKVIGKDEKEYFTSGGNRLYKWVCKCSCGNIVSVERNKLKSGHTRSCGCLMASRLNITFDEYKNKFKDDRSDGNKKDIIGERFGKLVVISETQNKSSLGRRKLLCRCDCGNEVEVIASNLLSNHTRSCGCIDSTGEMFISQFLTNQNIKFDKEYTFSDCRDKAPLPFDFGIFDCDNILRGLIEYDGKQHFEIVRFNGMTPERAKESFYSTVKHDKIKTQYCVEHNIPLLRLRYDNENYLDDLRCFLKEVC